jgi:hypothetical protein
LGPRTCRVTQESSGTPFFWWKRIDKFVIIC